VLPGPYRTVLGDQRLEACFGRKPDEFAVVDPRPCLVRDGADVVADEQMPEIVGQVLVKQDPDPAAFRC